MSDTADVGTGPTLQRTPSSAGGTGTSLTFDSLKGAERFATGELIGRGGMGEVFGCTDLRLERPMAIKQATSHSAADLERFVREARVQGQLQHPGIVPVHELGLTPEGLPYFTMKRVRGETLAEVIAALQRKDPAASEKHSRRRLLGAFGSVCQAVEFAHTQGVLHRDLKPANVMLGDFGEVYVLDWGLAKPLAQDETVAAEPMAFEAAALGATPTVAGSLLGTPGYMAPELVAGKPASVQSDVFALGSLLFELLALERMIPGETVVEILTRTRDGFDPSVRGRCPSAEVAPELDVVVKRACAREPSERFGSVRALHEAVERVLAGERDVELRAELAKVHAANAAAEVARMRKESAVSEEARARAAQEVGRSLTLDPKNRAAFGALLELLQTPPKELPDLVKESLRRGAVQATRRGARLAGLAFLVLASLFVWFPKMGVRHGIELGALFGLTFIGAAGSFVMARMKAPPPELLMFCVVPFMAIGGVLNTGIMPFIVGPALIISAALVHLPLLPRSLRYVTVGVAVAALTAPLWVALLGGPAPVQLTAEGGLLIPARLVAFTEQGWTHGLIVDSVAGTLVVAAIAAGQTRKTLEQAQQRIAVQAWNLRLLLPPEVGDATLLDDTAADPKCALEGFFESRVRVGREQAPAG